MKVRVCELCNGEAAVYCSSDSAFLCWNCDSKVHGANFLVARHDRRTVCSKCKGLTCDRVSGIGLQPVRPICHSCSLESPGDDDLDSLSSPSPSACISTTESCASPPKKIDFDSLKSDGVVSSSSVTGEHSSKLPARFSGKVTSKSKSRAPRAVESKAEDVFVNWCRRLGLSGSCEVATAIQALRICLDELTVLPLRVSLAASLWFSMRLCGDISSSTWQILKRLEEVSGVPAKLILGAESKLARALKTRKTRRRDQHVDVEEEGWAEC
ncbi:B-box zinc finger protein 32 [Cornus florida]|uniref:B-box zinc finger protein 32 n=1 Tax=Cornus florida TaxID=4283 RepID=UPI00289D2972|nr:B-box zinc finger protein 32 [Cornus florida]